MKTLRLTKPESTAYANGELRFWRAMKPQPDRTPFQLQGDTSTDWFTENFDYPRRGALFSGRWRCPYGTPGNRIRLSVPNQPFSAAMVEHDIAAITVEQRDGNWGWLVEVAP